MNTIELFSGTKSFSKVAQKLGYDTFTIDNNIDFEPNICCDILELNINTIKDDYNILWASPPCTTFSVASISKHWHPNYKPKSKESIEGLLILEKTVQIISILKPKIWFIENPRGMMRKIIPKLFDKYNIKYNRHTITYCQYGDKRMKPTDVWTNSKQWQPRKMCKNGDDCHEPAPRGSKTGTQGLSNAKERGIIPAELFKEIFEHINNNKNTNITFQSKLI